MPPQCRTNLKHRNCAPLTTGGSHEIATRIQTRLTQICAQPETRASLANRHSNLSNDPPTTDDLLEFRWVATARCDKKDDALTLLLHELWKQASHREDRQSLSPIYDNSSKSLFQ